MATSFDISAFDPAAFEIDQTVDLATIVMDVSPQPFRISQVASPLLDTADTFLVIGFRIDIQKRRLTYICEQVIPTTVVITHPTGTGFAIPETVEPTLLVKHETWEPDLLEPTFLVKHETWEMFPGGESSPGTLYLRELFEA